MFPRERITADQLNGIERIDDGDIVAEPIFDRHLATNTMLGPDNMPCSILARQIGYIPILFVFGDIIDFIVPEIKI